MFESKQNNFIENLFNVLEILVLFTRNIYLLQKKFWLGNSKKNGKLFVTYGQEIIHQYLLILLYIVALFSNSNNKLFDCNSCVCEAVKQACLDMTEELVLVLFHLVFSCHTD